MAAAEESVTSDNLRTQLIHKYRPATRVRVIF